MANPDDHGDAPRPDGPRLPSFVPLLCTVVLLALTGVAWTLTTRTASTGSAGSGSVALSGGDLFRAKGCATCHDGPSSKATVNIGPNLATLAAVAASREPGVGPRDYVRRSIMSPGSFVVPGFSSSGMGAMPALAVTPAEVEALVAYLLPPGG